MNMIRPSILLKLFGIALIILVAIEASAQSRSEPMCCSHDSHAQKTSKSPAQSYVCPMHPEVKSSKPGKCAKCKMDMRKVKTECCAAETNPDPPAPARSRNNMLIPDVDVLDQDGKALHFYTDLIKDKTVAINFIFTNCTTICPPLAATFARLQKEMGDKV